MSDEDHRSDSFVVRIWWEQAEKEQPFWRGWIQHAITGNTSYFHCIVDLLSFIEGYTGSLTQAPEAEPDKKGGIV
ncbi:MAG: hypothetical protein GVY30_05935 [Chloroflexi bacterium]|nr:hypothetical protein [Chloroflexota bacterium]